MPENNDSITDELENLDSLLKQFTTLSNRITKEFEQKRHAIEQRRQALEQEDMFSRYDNTLIQDFFKKPYVILPRRGEEEWYLIVPKFFDLNVGYLTKSTDSYNVFIVNKYADYLGAVPEEFKRVFKFKPKLPLRVYNGMLLTGDQHQDAAWERYKRYLVRREGDDRIRIKKGYDFKLVADLIDDGILPFIPKPVEPEHLRTPKWQWPLPDEIARRRQMAFFQDAFDRFLKTGAVGIYWAMGVGKTIFGLEALSRVHVDNRKNLVISGMSVALREQWEENLKKLIKPAAPVRVETYHSYHKIRNKPWGLAIFDECHHLPANTFTKLSTLDCEYRIGLSATPYREDGRTNYIFALTGFPVGLDWRVLLELDLIREPTIILILCTNYTVKKQQLKALLKDPMKTLIYCFSLKRGKRLSREFEIPFVYGDTPVNDRLDIIRNSQTTIISSAGKEGLSLQDIERTISYNFLFGSRQEEAQFFGRLLHGQEGEGHHYILMTDEEYEKYGKRLYGIQEKGFKIQVVRA